MENITERVRAFIRFFHSEYNYFEELTGVRASKWRDLDREKTKAVTAEMIEELCRVWPEFAYWFVAGVGESPRGQVTPMAYHDLQYGSLRAFEPSGYEILRDAKGILRPDLGAMGLEKSSEKYEQSIAKRVLSFSGAASQIQAEKLAEQFWSEVLKPLKNGATITLSNKSIKDWVNNIAVDKTPPDGFSPSS